MISIQTSFAEGAASYPFCERSYGWGMRVEGSHGGERGGPDHQSDVAIELSDGLDSQESIMVHIDETPEILYVVVQVTQ
jgi:hypothetical protein